MLNGKNILVTGSADGIGLETARALMQLGATVFLHARNTKRMDQAESKIPADLQPRIGGKITGDLSNPEEISGMRDQMEKLLDGQELYALVNNAGIFSTSHQLTNWNGTQLELTFAVNHLAYYLLTLYLLPRISTTEGRIVNVASMAQSGSREDWRDYTLQRYEGYHAYSRSKLANILFTYELDRRLRQCPGNSITTNVLHPGVINTKLLHAGFGSRGAPLAQGAETSVYLATSDKVREVSGKYFSNSQERKTTPLSYDENFARDLWEVSRELTGEDFICTP